MTNDAFGACPTPLGRYDRIVLGHGSGGTLSAALVKEIFLAAFDDPTLAALEDQATLAPPPAGHRLAVTTDAFVVSPAEFPGGDIGVLAVAGTVNDLVVGGARPRYLTASFILEEGTPIDLVRRITASMASTSRHAGVAVVAGDTKVVERGKGDGIFVSTTGVGFVPPGRDLSASRARPGDRVLVSGTLGDHGIAIMCAREGLELETTLQSDVAPLGSLVEAMLEASPNIRCMRDPTRGGLASALTEIAEASRVGAKLDEAPIPLKREVRAACEVLGLDPLYVACEGRLVAIVPPEDADATLRAMRAHELGRDAAIVGTIVDTHAGRVSMRAAVGGERFVMRLSGEQLPRIC
ncbi:MAG: hydrogenase expression/formation protein HypE [Polyangiaceae bacterium]|nr:hydrogenase expression/formation protein HypE [Polyangiaceae bacterium]